VILVAQLSMCAVILIIAGLFLRTVSNLRSQELGFDRNVLLVPLNAAAAGYSDQAAAMLPRRVTDRRNSGKLDRRIFRRTSHHAPRGSKTAPDDLPMPRYPTARVKARGANKI
jgi:hypothetical protein